jgi:stage II sporulation protein D
MVMLTPIRIFAQWGRRSGRRLVSFGAVLLLTGATVLTVLPAGADQSAAAREAVFTVKGAGYGHGLGMSQYGAYGAAKRGLTWKEILAFYYPGTHRAKQAAGATIKVWITGDSDNDLRVMPGSGLRLSDASGHVSVLPTGPEYTAWRIARSGSGYALSYLKKSGSWARQKPALTRSTWSFSGTAKTIKVLVAGGARREFRGSVSLVKRGRGGRVVNRLLMEDYVKGVVPAEMPTSWLSAAVRAQAVAARSYAARLQASAPSSRGYDLCDTSACQVYRGYASTLRGRRTGYETKNGNAAVKATACITLKYRGAAALTQFASSNGGSSAKGDFPYLVAQVDPYDGVITSNAWTRKLTASGIARAWPTVGNVKQLHVSARNGVGRWGGRVTSIKIIGSKRTVTVKGTAFASRFGFRSSLFTFGAAAGR